MNPINVLYNVVNRFLDLDFFGDMRKYFICEPEIINKKIFHYKDNWRTYRTAYILKRFPKGR